MLESLVDAEHAVVERDDDGVVVLHVGVVPFVVPLLQLQSQPLPLCGDS